MAIQLKYAFFIVWIVISVIVCCILAAPFLLQSDMLHNLIPECEWQTRYGKACPLCGMTHSFVLISSGRFSEARAANQHSLFLYATFFINSILFLSVVFKRMPTDSLKKLIKVQLVSNSRINCASVSGYSPQTRSFRSGDSTRSRSASEHITGTHVVPSTGKAVRVSPSRPLSGLVSELCFRKRPSFLAPQRFAQENPTPCSNEFIKLIR
jgi:hypothetical protein